MFSVGANLKGANFASIYMVAKIIIYKKCSFDSGVMLNFIIKRERLEKKISEYWIK